MVERSASTRDRPITPPLRPVGPVGIRPAGQADGGSIGLSLRHFERQNGSGLPGSAAANVNRPRVSLRERKSSLPARRV
jgi:hypothetical protein